MGQTGVQTGFQNPVSQPRLNPVSCSDGVRRSQTGSIKNDYSVYSVAAYKAAAETEFVSRPPKTRSNDRARAVRAVGVRPARALTPTNTKDRSST
jgi:hypothetical protein